MGIIIPMHSRKSLIMYATSSTSLVSGRSIYLKIQNNYVQYNSGEDTKSKNGFLLRVAQHHQEKFLF